MNQSANVNKRQGDKAASTLLPLRVAGKLHGILDLETLQLSIKRGKIRATFDLEATAKAGRAVIVPDKEAQ